MKKIESFGITNAYDRGVVLLDTVEKLAGPAISAGFVKQQNQGRLAGLQCFEQHLVAVAFQRPCDNRPFNGRNRPVGWKDDHRDVFEIKGCKGSGPGLVPRDIDSLLSGLEDQAES